MGRWRGLGRTEGLLNAGSALNATACAEKLHSLLQSPLRDVRSHARAHELGVGAAIKGRRERVRRGRGAREQQTEHEKARRLAGESLRAEIRCETALSGAHSRA